MNPLNPFFSVIIFLIAFSTGYLIKANYKITFANPRNECIDGLRGLLALNVFICHSTVWHQYIHTGIWAVPKSNLYTQFGEASVSLFLMITSFLFISKLLNVNEKRFSWLSFFISRVFRLVPMYFFSVVLMVVTIIFISGWQLNVTILVFIKSVINWLLFIMFSTPDINKFESTFLISGVVWTLRYEWLFYFSLPLIAIFILKEKPQKRYIITGVVFLVMYLYFQDVKPYLIYSFIGGAIAPVLLKYTSFGKRINSTVGSTIILVSLFFIANLPTANNIYCLVFITVVFTLIASGNSLFGLFRNRTLQFLGDMCYSTYLLHLIILFIVFYCGVGIEKAKALTPFQYCGFIFLITPFLVVASFLGFIYIEKPFMDRSKWIIKRLNSRKAADSTGLYH